MPVSRLKSSPSLPCAVATQTVPIGQAGIEAIDIGVTFSRDRYLTRVYCGDHAGYLAPAGTAL